MHFDGDLFKAKSFLVDRFAFIRNQCHPWFCIEFNPGFAVVRKVWGFICIVAILNKILPVAILDIAVLMSFMLLLSIRESEVVKFLGGKGGEG